MFGRPLAVVGLNRTVLLPAGAENVKPAVVQVLHAPVPAKGVDWSVEPLTITLAVRLVVVPLAKRTTRVTVPAAGALTVNCAAAPIALRALQKPVPVKPAWLVSMVPSQVAGALSASWRTVAAWATAAGNATNAPQNR